MPCAQHIDAAEANELMQSQAIEMATVRPPFSYLLE
jgi:hypothetical protein